MQKKKKKAKKQIQNELMLAKGFERKEVNEESDKIIDGSKMVEIRRRANFRRKNKVAVG